MFNCLIVFVVLSGLYLGFKGLRIVLSALCSPETALRLSRVIVVHPFKAGSCLEGFCCVFVFYLSVFQLFIIIILCYGKCTIHPFQPAKIMFFLIRRIFFLINLKINVE
jgi:hypothetical protein